MADVVKNCLGDNYSKTYTREAGALVRSLHSLRKQKQIIYD